jgi:hypothetical protein
MGFRELLTFRVGTIQARIPKPPGRPRQALRLQRALLTLSSKGPLVIPQARCSVPFRCR